MRHYANENGGPLCEAPAELELGVLRIHLARNLAAVDCPACTAIYETPAAETEEALPVTHLMGDDQQPVCGATPDNGILRLALTIELANCVNCLMTSAPEPEDPASGEEPDPPASPSRRRRSRSTPVSEATEPEAGDPASGENAGDDPAADEAAPEA